MSVISLVVHIVPSGSLLSLNIEADTLVFDLCREIRARVPDANTGNPNDYGIFVPEPDPRQAYWLENSKTLSTYALEDRTEVEYRFKHRRLIIRTLDGTKKTLRVDDSKTIAELMLPICSKMGITNHEEYSVIRELDEDERVKSMTIRKSKSIAKDYEKLERLKQKLHTDDDLNWLAHAKTLRQHGIEETEELILRRKYFFSDQNVDARDPVQLNLLFVQLKDAILNGTHPVTQDEAIQLAGIQCQVEFGNFIAEKMKSMSPDLKDFLPKEYARIKGFDKKVSSHHARLTGLTEMDARVRYVQFCRSLKTYGITFFLVKEKIKGRNKLSPRLFGISKESVMRVDERTKEILRTWPLTTIRRWAAAANLFTVDFGEYTESNLVMQTTEGEQIAQLISGYIDIILRKQRSTDYLGIDGDEDCTMFEETVSHAKASVIEHQRMTGGQFPEEANVALPGVVRTAQNTFSQGRLTAQGDLQVVLRRTGGAMALGHVNQNAQQFQMHDLGQPQRLLLSRIDDSLQIIQSASDDLARPVQMNGLGHDAASKRWRHQHLEVARAGIGSTLGAMSMATGDLVSMVAPECSDSEASDTGSVDYGILSTAVTTIGLHMKQLMDNVRLAYALAGEDADFDEQDPSHLVDAARTLAGAFQALMKAAQPGETGEPPQRKSILEAAARVGEASKELLHVALADRQGLESEWAARDGLLGRAKLVASATANLVMCSKRAAPLLTEDVCGPGAQTRLINAAKLAGITTSQLVTCAKVIACSMEQPSCQQKLVNSAKQVGRAVEGVLMAIHPLHGRHDQLAMEVEEYTASVHGAVEDLLMHLNQGSVQSHQDPIVDTLLTAGDRISVSLGDSTSMVWQAQVLAKASSQLVTTLKRRAEAEPQDSDSQRSLYSAAKSLADATTRLVETAKSCASQPHQSLPHQQALVSAARDLSSLVQESAIDDLRARITGGLEYAGRVASSCAAQMVTTSQEAAKRSRASCYQICNDAADMVNKILPRVVCACGEARVRPQDPLCQSDLLIACQDLMQCFDQLVKSSQALTPTIRDPFLQSALSGCVQESVTCLGDLRRALQQAEMVFPAGQGAATGALDAALDRLRRLHSDLATARTAVEEGTLLPLPGEKMGDCCATVVSSVRCIRDSAPLLMTTVTGRAEGQQNGDWESRERVERLAGELAGAVAGLVDGCRGLAAFQMAGAGQNVAPHQLAVLQSVEQVAMHGEMMLQLVKHGVTVSINEDVKAKMDQTMSNLLSSTTSCLWYLPGQREVEAMANLLANRSRRLSSTATPIQRRPSATSVKSSQQLMEDFNSSAAVYNQIVTELSNGDSMVALPEMTARLTDAYDQMMQCGEVLTVANNNEGPAAQEVLEGLRDVTNRSRVLLDTLRGVLNEGGSDVSQSRYKHALLQAAGAVSASVNQLISACTASSGGSLSQRQCETSLRQLESLRITELAAPPDRPRNQKGYLDCVQDMQTLTTDMFSTVSVIPSVAKERNSEKFCDAIKHLTEATSRMIEASTQTAFLVGVAHPRSEPSRTGLEVHAQPLREHQTSIRKACAAILNPATQSDKAREYASVVAKRAGAVCQLCKQLIVECNDPTVKRYLVESAKEVAQATAAMVNSVRGGTTAADGGGGVVDRTQWPTYANSVTSTVSRLVDMITAGPEFAGQPSKIAPEAKQMQEPIMNASRAVLSGADNVLRAAHSLANDPQGPPSNQAYTAHSKNFTDSIRRLNEVVCGSAPGQNQCHDAQREIGSLIRDLDQASIAAANQSLSTGPVMRHHHARAEQNVAFGLMTSSLSQLITLVPGMVSAGTGRVEQIGHVVPHAMSYLQPLVQASIKGAAGLRRVQEQTELLEQTKTVLEATSQLFAAMQAVGANLQAQQGRGEVEEYGSGLREACQELTTLLNEISSREGNVDSMVESINKACTKLDEPPETDIVDSTVDVPPDRSFVSCQSRLVHHARGVAGLSQDLLTNTSRAPGGTRTGTDRSVHQVASALTQEFVHLSTASKDLCEGMSGQIQVVIRIRQTTQTLGMAVSEQIRGQLPEQARRVSERVADLVSALQATARGTQTCIRAAGEVSGVVADLDTAALFASAGTLLPDPTGPGTRFSEYREAILKSAKSLVTNTRDVVSGAATDQDQLAQAAQSCVTTITGLAEVVKVAATSLGKNQSEVQVMLINSARDVATSLVNFLNCTKAATGRPVNDPARHAVKEGAQSLVNSVTGLLKTVKTVEDVSLRGTRALEAAIDAMGQEARSLDQVDLRSGLPGGTTNGNSARNGEESSEKGGQHGGSPESLVRAAKPVMAATGKAVSAGNSRQQEEIMLAANAGRKAVTDLVRQLQLTLKSEPNRWANGQTDDEVERDLECRYAALQTGRQTVYSLIEVFQFLLKSIHESQSSPVRNQVILASRRVSETVHRLTSAAAQLKGSNMVDPSDPSIVAEEELFGAATQIEAAARKLAQLRPRKSIKNPSNLQTFAKEVDDAMSFDDQILSSAKIVVSATATLIQCASEAQLELVALGRMKPVSSVVREEEETQWSQGLVSAARMVAAAVQNVCESANALLQGEAVSERLISASRQVAASTAQLLVACVVKADAHSTNVHRLQEAGAAVKRATEALVREAQRPLAAEAVQQTEMGALASKSMVSSMRQIIQTHADIMTKEKELEGLRARLSTIRQEKGRGQSGIFEPTSPPPSQH